MRISTFAWLAATAVQSLFALGFAQTTRSYTEPNTGLTFWVYDVSTSSTTGGYTQGYVVPTGTNPTYEYIGIMIGSLSNGAGWSGISHAGPMTNNLLLMAWPYQKNIVHSFRYATGYVAPDIYTGNATATTIYSSVNSTNFVWVYRCQWCFAWNQNGATGSNPTTGFQVLGWAQNRELPAEPANPDSSAGTVQHDNGQGIYGIDPASASFSGYSSYVSAHVTTAVPTTTTVTTAPTTTTTVIQTSYPGTPVPTATYDYIVIGGGAGGIPIADKLSESGKKVLLIERGPPSSNRWGGYKRPDWLAGTNLSRFDVPGLDNQIWHDSAGIACPDVDQMAGCVLGGGTAVNAGLWWKPPSVDWDYNFPTGWKSTDMSAATSRVFSRIPGTDHPSKDGQLYLQQGYNVVAGGLRAAGWTNVTANNVPDQKNRTFSHTPYMYINGERGGPLATYLVTAKARSNFAMWTNTTVNRVIRNGAQITGVQVQAYGPGGYAGTVNVTPSTGRVILAAGTFGTPKILYRSGIGPTDQLQVVAASTSDKSSMISNSQWINLPVGKNLVEQTNTDVVIRHPDVVFYDFYEAYDDPIAADRDLYLSRRSGILAQSAPNIGPIAWDQIKGSDGITRQLQWTSRVEGSLGADNNNTMTISMYLGRGTTSRGAISITPNLDITVSTLPFLRDSNDVAAVVQGITNLQNALSNVKNLTWLSPAPGQSASDYVSSYVIAAGSRRSNHWMGTCKMGTDSGLNGGTSVVDTNTLVYGTKNLFIVDASIFPGQVTTNPSAFIVSVAEKAAEKILALPAGSGGATTTTVRTSTTSTTRTSTAPTATATHYAQCGGTGWTGATVCQPPYKCTYSSDYYSQCL